MKSPAIVPAAVLAVLVLIGLGRPSPARAQIVLMKSAPENGATVQAVPEVRIWLNEAPMEMGPGTVTVRVTDPAGALVVSGNAVRDPKDERAFALPLANGLEPGAYVATWRTMSDDGENVGGRIAFTVGTP
jgi:methionine-rich copper-binding protein CopC